MDLQTPPEKLYDLAFLEEMDDNEYLLGMLNLLVTDTPKELLQMKEAALKGDHHTVAKKAHVLKSTAGIVQADDFVKMQSTIEAYAKQPYGDPRLISQIHAAIELFNRIETDLKICIARLQ